MLKDFYEFLTGFGSTSGIAGAQAFNSQGPLGGFGASAANSGTQVSLIFSWRLLQIIWHFNLQGFNCGHAGCQGSAGLSGSQSYNLPGGRNVNVGYGGTFAGGSNAPPTYGSSNSISFT